MTLAWLRPAGSDLTGYNVYQQSGETMSYLPMAHAAERHHTRQATRATLANTSSVTLIFMGGWAGQGESGILLPLGFLKFMRDFELAADKLAVRTMAGAGWMHRPVWPRETRAIMPKVIMPTTPMVTLWRARFTGMPPKSAAAKSSMPMTAQPSPL